MDRHFPPSFAVINDFLTALIHTRNLTGMLAAYDYTLADLKNDPDFLDFAEEIKQYHFEIEKLEFIRTRFSLTKLAILLKAMQELYDIREIADEYSLEKVDLAAYHSEFHAQMSEVQSTEVWDRAYHGRSFEETVDFALIEVMGTQQYEIYRCIANLIDAHDHSCFFLFLNTRLKRIRVFKFGKVYEQPNEHDNSGDSASE